MFESDFPGDKGSDSGPVPGNALERLAGGTLSDERAAPFQGTAAWICHLPPEGHS